MKYKVGDKVILLSKDNSIEKLISSAVYKIIQGRNQNFAYITKCYSDIYNNYYVISEDPDGIGDFYIESDLKLYIKVLRKQKLQKINENEH